MKRVKLQKEPPGLADIVSGGGLYFNGANCISGKGEGKTDFV